MWLLELMFFVVVVGVIAGLVWRLGEDWLESRANRKQLELELVEEQTVAVEGKFVQPINVVGVNTQVSTTKSN